MKLIERIVKEYTQPLNEARAKKWTVADNFGLRISREKLLMTIVKSKNMILLTYGEEDHSQSKSIKIRKQLVVMEKLLAIKMQNSMLFGKEDMILKLPVNTLML